MKTLLLIVRRGLKLSFAIWGMDSSSLNPIKDKNLMHMLLITSPQVRVSKSTYVATAVNTGWGNFY